MNFMSDASLFIQQWDMAADIISPIEDNLFKKSVINNINLYGDYKSDSSLILTKNHPSFFLAIEEGVRELVRIIVQKLNWICYSSCEGHPSYKDCSYKKRVVQLLPRDSNEENKIFEILNELTIAINDKINRMPSNTINLNVQREILQTNLGNHVTIKILFDNMNYSEQNYFNSLENAYVCFNEKLVDVSI